MAGVKEPLMDVLSKLETITVRNNDGQQVPLRSRIFNNQLVREQEGKQYAYEKPCVFVEVINKSKYDQLGEGFQSSDIGFRLHLVHEEYDTGDGMMDQNINIFDLRDKVVRTLSLYEPTGCGPLTRVGEDQDYDHSNLYHYMIDFVCNFTDSRGSKWDQGKLIDKDPPTDLEIDVYWNSALSQIININVAQPEKTFSAQYTASDADGEYQVFLPNAIGAQVVLAMIEIKPLLTSQYTWDPVNGFFTLSGGIVIQKDQTIFFILSKPNV